MFSCTQPIRRSAQTRPNGIATVFGDRQRTFIETENRIACLAAGLRKLNVSGARAAILAYNSDRYFEAFFAIPWAAGVVVPLNIRWSIPELVYSLNDSQASVLFVDDAFLAVVPALRSDVKSLTRMIYIGEQEAPEGMIAFEGLIAESDPVGDTGLSGDELLAIFYTGGTTGLPKGVMLSHNNFYSASFALMSEMGIKGRDVRYLHAAPMFHIADAAIGMANAIAGNTHVFTPFFEPAAVIDEIGRCQITDALLVPTMVGMLLGHPALETTDISSLQKIIYGASPMPSSVLKCATETFPNVEFFQAYGQTELSPVITVLRPEHHVFDGEGAERIRSAGQASVMVEIKVVDSQGNALHTGQVGEVLVKGPNAMLGYWGKPDETAAALADGWVKTGDAGYLDADGFLFLVDRVKDMIVSGGENVFSAEVEHAIAQHPGVLEGAVIGIPSEKWGEEVHAVVRLRSGFELDEGELIEFCKKKIASYKCPRSVKFTSNPLPTTSVGKISKVDIRRPYWDSLGRAVN
jgi:acyl-CoA synthetase (AMP-forming)/AMP-acid ligase II